MYKVNDWNMNRLFVTYMRLRHNDLVKYQAVLRYYKEAYIYEFGRVLIYRGLKKSAKRLIRKITRLINGKAR